MSDLLFPQPLVSVSQKVEKINVLGLRLQRPADRYDFGLKLAGHLLRGGQPQPDVRPIGFCLERCFQVGNGLRSFAQLAIVNPKEKIGAGKPRFEFERAEEFCHRFGRAIQKLVDQTEVHMNFREIRREGKHGPVFPLRCSVLLIALGLLGRGKVGLDRRIPSGA